MTRLLPLLLFIALAAGVSRLRLESDSLRLLPDHVPGIAELRRIEAQSSVDRTLLMLVEGKLDAVKLQALPAKLASVPGTVAARLAGEEKAADSPATAALMTYLMLNQDAGPLREALQSGVELDEAAMMPALLRWHQNDALVRRDDLALIILEGDAAMKGYQQQAAWIERLRQAASAEGWRVSFTGPPAFAAEFGEALWRDMVGTAGICAVLIVLLFLWFQRSLRQLVALVLCLAVTVIAALGCYGWVFGELGMVSAGFAAILMGLTVDYAMIVGREVCATGSIAAAREHSRKGIFWGALTTAAPFAVMMTSSMPGGKQLGLLVMSGLAVGAWVMVECYPRLAFGNGAVPAALTLPLRSLPRRAAMMLCVVLSLLAAAGIWMKRENLRLTFDIALMQPAQSQAKATQERLAELLPAQKAHELHLVAFAGQKTDLEAAQREIEALKQKGIVSDFLLPGAFWPEKAHFDENIAMLQNHRSEVPERFEPLAALAEKWSQSGIESAWKEVREHPLLRAHAVEDTLGRLSLGTIRLKEALDAETHAKLRQLDATGLHVVSHEMLRFDLEPLLARDVRLTLLPMAFVLALCVLLALRSLREALAAVLLLIIAAVLVLALVLWTGGGSLHFLHVLGLILLMGAGLDYTLHMLFALRRSDRGPQAVFAGTGMAIVFCAVSTAIGFGSLLRASTPAMSDLGLVAGSGVLVVMLLALFVLPGLVRRR
jgi:uncharacterized protein